MAQGPHEADPASLVDVAHEAEWLLSLGVVVKPWTLSGGATADGGSHADGRQRIRQLGVGKEMTRLIGLVDSGQVEGMQGDLGG